MDQRMTQLCLWSKQISHAQKKKSLTETANADVSKQQKEKIWKAKQNKTKGETQILTCP